MQIEKKKGVAGFAKKRFETIFEARMGIPWDEWVKLKEKPLEDFNFDVVSGDPFAGLTELKKVTDKGLDPTIMSFQFATAMSMAFQSANVKQSLVSLFQSAVMLSQALNITTPGAAGGIMAGISFISSLFGLGGGNRLPSPTRPVDVRLVEIVGQAATHMLGITQRRLIVGSAGVNRGVDFRNELRVMP
jgi:hypothetical protein